jgi:serine/threonine-protein kinase RsbT
MSPILARSVLRRALERAAVSEKDLSSSNLPQLREHLDNGARLFADPSKSGNLLRDLGRLSGSTPSVAGTQIKVQKESDISEARVVAWQIAERLGARRYTLQRVATIVSELARNIASYTSGGIIELVVTEKPTPKLNITARDEGRGIPNLDEIMAGKYRSKTGLGVGIVATKRLADHFDIKTGNTGTVVEVEVRL